jgi:hypothetical protein
VKLRILTVIRLLKNEIYESKPENLKKIKGVFDKLFRDIFVQSIH